MATEEPKKEFWLTKCIYYEKLTGQQVIQKSELANTSDGQFVFATQPFLRSDGLYNVFIHYKADPKKIKTLDLPSKPKLTKEETFIEKKREVLENGTDVTVEPVKAENQKLKTEPKLDLSAITGTKQNG